MNRLLLVSLVTTLVWLAVLPTAQAQPPTKTPQQIYEDSVVAFEHHHYQRALDLLDLAIYKDHKPRYIYQRILVLEAMGDTDRALRLLKKRRKKLAGQPGVGDLTALEQRLEEARASTDDDLTDHASTARSEGPDYIAWTLIGSGAVAAGGGVTLLLLAESDLTEVRCSGIYPDSQRTDCAGVDAPAQLSRAQFDRRMGRVDTYRILGGSLLAVGAVAAGYGAYRLLFPASETPAPSASRSVAWDVGPRPEGGMQVQLSWHF